MTKLSLAERGFVTDMELRQILGNVSPMTLHRYRHDENLGFPKAIKLKSRNLTSYEELAQWMQDQRSKQLGKYLTPTN